MQFARFHSPVPVFPGKPADRDNRCIGKCLCSRKQLLRNLRLLRHARHYTFGILLRRHFLIKVRQRCINCDLSFCFFYFHPFLQAAHIIHSHIAASAAALYIICAALSEQRDLFANRNRKYIVLIFQKHHTLPCRLPRQSDMLF